MSDLIHQLQDHGFSETESKIYLALVQIGPSPASRLAKHLGMSRLATYNIIQNLTQKHLIGHEQRQKTQWFYAIEARIWIEKQRKRYESQLGSLDTVLHQLSTLQTITAGSSIQHLSGRTDVQMLYQTMLDSSQIYSIIGTTHDKSPEHLRYVYDHYIPERMRKQIPTQTLLSPIAYDRFHDYVSRHKTHAESYHRLDGDHRHCEYSLSLFGQHDIALISDNRKANAIWIRDPALYQFLLAVHQMLWANYDGER